MADQLPFTVAPLADGITVSNEDNPNFIPLATDTPSVQETSQLNPEDLTTRVNKYDFALGDKSPGVDELERRIMSGMEDRDRERYAMEKTIELHQQRVQMVRDMSNQAASEGRDLSLAETQTILGLSSLDLSPLKVQAAADQVPGTEVQMPRGTLYQDPTTIFEREYARKVLQNAVQTGEDTPYSNSLTEDPEHTMGVMDAFENTATFKEAYSRLAQDMDALVAKQSTIGYTADFLKGFAPGYTWWKTHNVVNPVSDMLPGNNMADSSTYAYTGKPEERIPEVVARVKKLAEDNPQLAAIYAHNLVEYPATSQLLDNTIIPITDIISVFPFGLVSKLFKGVDEAAKLKPPMPLAASVYRAVEDGKPPMPLPPGAYQEAAKVVVQNASKSAVGSFTKTVSDIAKAVMKPNVTIPEVLDSAGQTVPSAATSIVDKIVHQWSNISGNEVGMRDLLNEVPGLMNAPEVINGIGSTGATRLTSEAMQDLVAQGANALKKIFLDPVRSARAGPKALEAAITAASSTFKIERRDLENAIMNVFENNIDQTLGAHTAVIHLGDEKAVAFPTRKLAENNLKAYGLEGTGATVEQTGNSFVIQLQRPLDFTLDSVRKAMVVDAKDAPLPMSNMLGKFLIKLRSGEDVIPRPMMERMKIATYGSTGLEKMMTTMAKSLGVTKLRNPEDFLAFLRSEQNERNALNPNKLGMFSKDQGELDMKWMQRFNRIPTEQESKAYWAYKMINDVQYVAMNLGLYLDKMALGLSNLVIKGLPEDLKVEGKITTYEEYLQHGQHNAKILVLEEGQEPQVLYSKYNRPISKGSKEKVLDHMRDLIKNQGYIISRVSDVGDDAIRTSELFGENAERGIGRGRFHFVVSKEVKSTPLSAKQVPYQMGGHNIMPDGWYLSQPKMGFDPQKLEATYYGDRNILFAANEKTAKEFAGHFETARKMLLELKGTKKKADPIAWTAKEAAIKAYVKEHLPVSYSQLKKDFGKDGYMDINSPILARASNQNLASAHPLADMFKHSRFIVHSQSDLNLYRGHVNLDFATERGLPVREIVTRGDPDAPVYGLRPARLLDPMAAIDRGTNAMLRGRYFEPLKRTIADDFLARFGDLLNPSNHEQSLDPFRAMKEMDFKTNLAGSDLERQRQAYAYAARANQFFGTAKSPEAKYYEYVLQKLVGTGDPETMGYLRKSMADILASKVHPAEAFKQLAFHPKMGLWNIKQLLQQGNTIINVAALAGPKIAWEATRFSMLHNFVMKDPERFTEYGAEIARKWGLDPERFLEVTRAMERTSFHKMGREVATREQHMEGRIVQTRLGAILDNGLYFMKQGEEFVRRAAFNAAYLEQLDKFPGKTIDDRALARILDRADTMNVNMSHASNAAWQQGFASIPTQFWSYQIRLFEQLAGKRLTTAEKARLLGTYSLVYGLPIGATTVMPFWPVHESIKEWLIQHNIDTNDNLITKTLNDGILSAATQLVTGEDTNIENIYGPSGIPFLSDLFKKDKNIFEAMGGASGNVLFNVIAGSAPAFGWIWQSVIGNEREPLKAQDFVDVLSNISSLNTLQKMYIAMSTSSYLSRSGQTIATDDNKFRIIINNLLGIQPQAIDDMYRTMQVNSDYRDFQMKMAREVGEDIRNMVAAKQRGDEKDAADWAKRAQVKSKWYSQNPQDVGKLFLRILGDNEDLVTKSAITHARQSREAAQFEENRLNRIKDKAH